MASIFPVEKVIVALRIVVEFIGRHHVGRRLFRLCLVERRLLGLAGANYGRPCCRRGRGRRCWGWGLLNDMGSFVSHSGLLASRKVDTSPLVKSLGAQSIAQRRHGCLHLFRMPYPFIPAYRALQPPAAAPLL